MKPKLKKNLIFNKMKCIKAIKNTGPYKQGHLLRVVDKDADLRVSTGDWKFIPKSEFKGADVKEVIQEVVEEKKKKKTKKS